MVEIILYFLQVHEYMEIDKIDYK